VGAAAGVVAAAREASVPAAPAGGVAAKESAPGCEEAPP